MRRIDPRRARLPGLDVWQSGCRSSSTNTNTKLFIKATAQAKQMTVAEWVRLNLGRAKLNSAKVIKAKLRAIEEASRLNHPTADIDVMLEEIAAGRNASWYSLTQTFPCTLSAAEHPNKDRTAIELLADSVGTRRGLHHGR